MQKFNIVLFRPQKFPIFFTKFFGILGLSHKTLAAMATTYRSLYSYFKTTDSKPNFEVQDKTEIDIKSWIFP